jgi:AraC-like DNA-binding protein
MFCDALRRASPAPTLRVGGLVEIPALLRELGADPLPVLSAAGLHFASLNHIDNRIPVDAADRLLGAAADHTGCSHIGLLAGQRWKPWHFGQLGELMECSPTVGDALRVFAAFQQLNSDTGAAFVLDDGDTAALGYTIYRTELRHPQHVYDAAIAVACNLMRDLCRLHWAAREVLLARPAPSDVTPYRQCFRAGVRFDHAYSAVRFSRRWLTQPLARTDPARYRELLEEVGRRDGMELIPRVHRALRVLLIQGRSSGNELAQILSLHRRTLNRRLRAEGTTFQKVLDEQRLLVARQLLLHTDSAINEIASALCYADVSAFMRAFRRWTGTTPAHFREQLRATATSHDCRGRREAATSRLSIARAHRLDAE